MDAQAAKTDTLSDAVAALRAGGVVVYPTETFYALGSDALSARAVRRLFSVKSRAAGKPIALIAADARMAFGLARSVGIVARALADAFWPGPLTIVFPAREGVPKSLLAADGSVGIRVSSHPVARALAAGLGRPLTATSANLAGEPPATTLSAARAAFGDKVDIYLEGGNLGASLPSTVITCSRTGFTVIRPGATAERELLAALSARTLE